MTVDKFNELGKGFYDVADIEPGMNFTLLVYAEFLYIEKHEDDYLLHIGNSFFKSSDLFTLEDKLFEFFIDEYNGGSGLLTKVHDDDIFNRVRYWAFERGLYDKGDVKTQYVKLAEEFGEVGRAIIKDDLPEIRDGLGDMFVVMVNLAHLADMTLEECIEAAWNEIKDRKGSMKGGSFVKEEE